MSNQTINPINHGVVSAAGHTAGGAVVGGLKLGAKTILYTAGAFALFGGLWGAGLLGAVGIAGGTMVNTMIGVVGGGVVGTFLGSFVSPFTATVGAAKGGSQAYDRVREEKGAANMVKAQLQGMQMQAMAERSAPTTVYAPTAVNDNKYGSASTMNLADSNIQAASVQLDGRAAGAQLQRA